MYLFSKLTDLLPPSLRPRAKAAWPMIGTAIGVAVQWAVTGEFDRAELVTAITGAAAAVLTYEVPNKPAVRAARRA